MTRASLAIWRGRGNIVCMTRGKPRRYMMQICGCPQYDGMYQHRIIGRKKMLAEFICSITGLAIVIAMQQLLRRLSAKQPGNGLFEWQ